MKSNIIKSLLALSMTLANVNAMENPKDHITNFRNKSFNDWQQADLDVALKNTVELQQLFESAEVVEFSAANFDSESLKKLMNALESKAVIGMQDENVDFIRPLTKGLIDSEKLKIEDKKI